MVLALVTVFRHVVWELTLACNLKCHEADHQAYLHRVRTASERLMELIGA